MNDRFKDIKPGQPGNAGRAEYKVDYKTLDSLCAIQCTGEECASILNVDYETLNTALKRDKNGGFVEYFKRKSAAGKVSLRRKQYKSAVEDGNTTMMIWLGKQYLEQSDKQDVTNDAKVSFSDALMGALKDGQQPSNTDSAEESYQ